MKYIIKNTFYLVVILNIMFYVIPVQEAAAQSKELKERDRYAQADLFIQAVRERELGNLQKAKELNDEALAINSEDPASNYENARLLLAMGRKDEALLAAKKAFELDKENKWYAVLLANIAKANGNYEEYVAVYENLIEQYPNDIDFLSELAFAYFYTGEYQKAVDVYNRLEERVGINEMLSTQKVQLYDKIDQKDNAVAEYDKLISAFPDEPRYYALMAEYCSKNNLDDKAIWAYEKIVEIDPEDPYIHISLADFYKKKGENQRSFEELKLGLSNPKLELSTKINLLFAYYSGDLSDEQREQALELSEIIRQTHPDDALSEVFYASMLYENKEYEESRIILRKVLKEEVGNYAAWEQLLFCNLYLEDNVSLAKEAEEAIDLFPNYPLPYFFAGIGNFQLKEFGKARTFLETGKEFVVNNNALIEQFYSTLGDTYNELGQYEASYEAYEKVLQINPDSQYVLNNYAYYLSLRSEKLDKAEKMAKRAVEIEPYSPSYLDTYAWVFYKQGKYKEAREWIEKAYRNGGDTSGTVVEHYGDILFQLKEYDEALKYWKLAKEQKEYSDLLDKKIKDKKLYE